MITASEQDSDAPKAVNGTESLKAALDSHKTITLRALDLVPASQRYSVYVLWTFSLLSFVAGSFLVLNSYATYAFIIYLMTFVCMLGTVIIQSKPAKTTPEQLDTLVQGQVSGPSWVREVLKIPIEKSKLNDFELRVRALRTQAVNFINTVRKRLEKPDVGLEKVRINVFLPDTRWVGDGEVCGLFIPSQMHENMSDFKDRQIKFRPHEGLTGRTFTLGEAGGALAAPDNQGNLQWTRISVFPQRPGSDEWERFELSDQQKALIEKRLRWIVSFPLPNKPEFGGKPLGVLNLDGLDDSLTKEELCSLAGNMEPQVNAFAKTLDQLPQVRIAIRVEDIQPQ